MFLLLAIAHHRLGNQEEAMKSFWIAYDMCHHNGLTAPFIEAGAYMLPLISLAGQQRQYEFSRDWLDLIHDLASGFAKRAEAVRAAYRKQNPTKNTKDTPLSRREREVLQALAQGLTREEIALKQYISVNTVKAAIRNIYIKLNANNRAEAVSMAIALGYIEGYMPASR